MIDSIDAYLALAESSDAAIHMTARHAQVTAEVWFELLQRGYGKQSVLLNKHLPLSVLAFLATDEDEAVRSAVATKRAAAQLLGSLAKDAHASVRIRVACNAKVTRDLLIMLAEDAESAVAEAAASRLLAMNQV